VIAAGLDEKLAELTAEQQQEIDLLQQALHAREDLRRAQVQFRQAEARLLQFRSEQQEAA